MLAPHASLDDLVNSLREISLDSNPLVQLAIEQTIKSHKDRDRYSGNSVLEEHIYPVTLSVIEHEKFTGQEVTPELVAGALLHDVLEDDKSMTDKLFREKFRDGVYSIVHPLNDKHYGGYSNMREKVTLAGRKSKALGRKEIRHESRLIFLADKFCNMCCMNSPLYTWEGKPTPVFEAKLYEAENVVLPFARKFSPFYTRKILETLEEYRSIYPGVKSRI